MNCVNHFCINAKVLLSKVQPFDSLYNWSQSKKTNSAWEKIPALAGGFFTSSAAWDPLSTQSWYQIPQVKGLVPKDHHTSDALCKSESPVLLTIRL